MKVTLPEPSLVVLAGPSGSGKSTFARRHFRPTEVISSDHCRGLVADDENDLSVTGDAFDLLHYIASKRLAGRRLTVIDATSVKPEDRARLIALAREFHLLAAAIVFDLPSQLCQGRNEERADRDIPPQVVRRQSRSLRRSLRGLGREGFHSVTVFGSPEEAEAASIERQPLWPDRRGEGGPFDIVGDVHGCYDELVDLLATLGWETGGGCEGPEARHPEGRKAVFLGDLVDRGPRSPEVLRLVMGMVAAGTALCVPGNHDVKLLRKLQGRDVKIAHGLAETLEQLENEPDEFADEAAAFIGRLVSHYVLDGGDLVVAHAGLEEALQGRASGRVREFALYGETTGETDEFGLPVRCDWAAAYRGRAAVVYGHTPVPEPEWVNGTLNIDTGCVFGGRLTALRYPEKEIVQVPARQVYCEPVRPLISSAEAEEARPYGDLLDIGDVIGKRVVSTRLHRGVTIRQENAAAALEVMSRFALDPRWLLYLPPTMAPSDTAADGEYLEHPRETFAYYRGQGVSRVICQEKHMGSRAVILLCRDEAAAQRRFGAGRGEAGVIHTRTGRPFFSDPARGSEVVARLRAAVEGAGLWQRFESDWICLDAEIMPWSDKAQELLSSQYAPAGAAAGAAFEAGLAALGQAAERGGGSEELEVHLRQRQGCISRYVDAYRRYCWTVDGLSDLRIAPFHLLATEGRVHTDEDHLWHMETLAELCRADAELLLETRYRLVDTADPDSEEQGTRWWHELTGGGGEGMVVKPLDWLARGRKGPAQPALKCRGREYLRIIYGPEYTLPGQIERLRQRRLSVKRSLALREFALGLEALHRFVEGEPLYRVHECVFGVLALESEPVDPRL